MMRRVVLSWRRGYECGECGHVAEWDEERCCEKCGSRQMRVVSVRQAYTTEARDKSDMSNFWATFYDGWAGHRSTKRLPLEIRRDV